jgi:hypothetical protein
MPIKSSSLLQGALLKLCQHTFILYSIKSLTKIIRVPIKRIFHYMGFGIKGIDNRCLRLNDCRALVNVSDDIECSMDGSHGGV